MKHLEDIEKKIKVIRASRNSRHTQIIEVLQDLYKVVESIYNIVMIDAATEDQKDTPGIIKTINESDAFLED